MTPPGVSLEYWAGAHDGRLVLQRCVACGMLRHYPQPLCPHCYSFEAEAVSASGNGAVHSWTVAHHAFDPSVADEVPYVLVTVDLQEGPRVLGRLASDDQLRIGMPVRIGFRAGQDGTPRLEVMVVEPRETP